MRRNAVELLDDSLSNLPFDRKIEFIDRIRELCFEHEMDALLGAVPDASADDPAFCPKCGSLHVQRFGSRNGRQRYRCAECGRTFAEQRPSTLVSSSKLGKATWMRYVNCFADGLTVAKCALNCNVSIRTSYYMRLRLLTIIEENLPAWKVGLDDSAVLDECFVRESFKGNRTKCKGFAMPRLPYQRGRASGKGAVQRTGLSRADQICIMSGTSGEGRVFFEIAGRGTMDVERCAAVLSGRIGKGAVVSTDDHIAYRDMEGKYGVEHRVYSSKANNGELNDVNGLHSHLRAFLAAKRGVSTRRLSLYLAEFAWRWNVHANSEDTGAVSDRIVRQIAETGFGRTRRSYEADPYPLCDYWESDEGKQESERRRLAVRQLKLNNDLARSEGDPDAEVELAERQKKLDEAIEKAGIKPEDKGRLVGKAELSEKRACTTHLLRGQRKLNAGALRKYLP